MPYRYETQHIDYSDLAAGAVVYSLPGRPAFPIRLNREIFGRCREQRRRLGRDDRCSVYDPLCGSAYLLLTLALTQWDDISAVVGSDADAEVLPLAERNLGLLRPEGWDRRIEQLADLYHEHRKPSHAHALAGARRIRDTVRGAFASRAIDSRLFAADALSGAALRASFGPDPVDLVLTDLPYGRRTVWLESAALPVRDTGEQLLEALLDVTGPTSVVAVTTVKQHKFGHPSYRRVEQFEIGKRRTLFFVRAD